MTDSGHFTLRDGRDIDSEMEPTSLDEDFQHMTPRKRHRRFKTARNQTDHSESPVLSHDDSEHMESEVSKKLITN